MKKQNPDHYSGVAKFLHWSIAILITFNLLSGLISSYSKTVNNFAELHVFHKHSGVIILTLVIFRIFWRITHKYPNLRMLPPSEMIIANFGHTLFYVLMVSIPIAGICFIQSTNHHVYFFGYTLPTIINPQPVEISKKIFSIHKYLAISLATLVIGHVIAALKHHYIDKNEVLKRIMPSFKSEKKCD